MSLRVAVFASGSGTNLQALLDRFQHSPAAPLRIALVIADRADGGAVARAGAAGVPTRIIAVEGRESGDVASETLTALAAERIDVIALAGYVRLVPQPVVAAYRNRIINIHPALLPAFGGKGMYGSRVHSAVLAAGCSLSGPTVHYVDERYDEGRIIAQWPVPVLGGDTPETLAARVLSVEHALYPIALELVALAVARGEAAIVRAGFDPAAHVLAFQPATEPGPNEAAMRRSFGLD